MDIDGKNIKVNVLILSMEREIDVLLQTIESLLISVEDGIVISVLLNGSTNDELRRKLAKFACIRYYESTDNLGVAGGRIFLCSTEEFRSADVICILDNDVVVTRDYLRKMATHLMSDQSMGAAGGVVVDIKRYYHKLESFKRKGGNLIGETHDLSCADVRDIFLEDPSPNGLYHVGIHKNWFIAYLTPYPIIQRFLNAVFEKLRMTRKLNVILKDDTKWLEKIKRGVEKFEVSNVAGCTQSFRRSLLEEIGNFNSVFSPYGLEDVDFNVRALRAGYRNYTLGDVWLLHGTDSRHEERHQEKMFENYYRVVTIFAYYHSPHFLFTFLVLLRIWCNRIMLMVMGNNNAKKYFDAQIRGLHKGLRELERKGVLNAPSVEGRGGMGGMNGS